MKKPQAPQWAVRLLESWIEPDMFPSIYGDLLEDFYQNINKHGLSKARQKFVWETFGFFRYPYLLRSPKLHLNPSKLTLMFGHYFTTSLRNFYKRKGFSLINILGLSFGVLVCILMAFYIQDELTYDRFHDKAERIYRTTISFQSEAKDGIISKIPFPAKAVLIEDYPEVEKVVRFYTNAALNNIPLISYGGKAYTEENFMFTDPEIFEVFDFKLIKGDSKTALQVHTNVLLTEATAKKYFGNEDPVGKVLRYQNETDLTVTGVVENPPSNSYIQFDFLAPVNLHRYKWMGGKDGEGYDLETDWNWAGCWLFALLKEGTDPLVFEQKLQAIAKKYFDEPGKMTYAINLLSLSNLHFDADTGAEMSAGGNRTQVYGLSIIVLLILLIAGINYMNLATARASERGREVGVRKVLGAGRGQLIGQFLGEAMILSLLAVLVAGGLAELLEPWFNTFTDKKLAIDVFSNPTNLLMLLSAGGLIGLLSGLYPAFVLSGFQPVKTLKNIFVAPTRSGISIRKTLVVVQFAISIILIIGVLVIWQQLDYLRNKDLGFQKENVLLVKNGWAIKDQLGVLKNELESQASIDKLYQGYVPGQPAFSNTFEVEGKTEATRMAVRHVGFDFFDMFHLPLVEGRAFIPGSSSDSSEAIIINEAALKHLNWTAEEAVGKQMGLNQGGGDTDSKYNLRVIGVAKDANFEPLHQALDPVVFKANSFGDVAIRVKTGQLGAALQDLEKTWQSVITDWPLEYTFLDDKLAQKYLKEEKLSQMIQYFAVLAIFIALMGLLGLVALTVHQRYKEIGIRKVLGASVGQIVTLLSRDFLKLVLVAIVVAVPVAWYLMREWLADFAYRIDLGIGVFLVAGILAVLLTMVMVGWQTFRAAGADPVEALKVE